MIDIENIWIDINCPKCNFSFGVKIIDVKLQSNVICHNCKISINLIDNNVTTHLSVKNINRELNKLKNLLKF